VGDDIRTIIIEDYDDLRHLLRLRLTVTDGFEVVGSAVNGEQGVALAAATQPDLVLLDVLMPVMSGTKALPLIRDVAPDAVVVYVTVLDDWAIEGIEPNRPLADAVVSKEWFMARPTEVIADLRLLMERKRR
jgi:DNA-binding NarL/FixJ family response regulator